MDVDHYRIAHVPQCRAVDATAGFSFHNSPAMADDRTLKGPRT